MNEADVTPLAAAFTWLMVFLGLAAFILWIRLWISRGYVLPYEPRRRVPWGPVSGVLAILMTTLGVVNGLALRSQKASATSLSADDFASSQLLMSGLQLLFAAAIVAVLITVSGASWRDLGLPNSMHQLRADIKLGVWIGLASIVPIYTLQAAAIALLGIPAAHPLLDQMVELPDPAVFLAAMLAAVVAAPVFEELVFRLLLQGGLEHWEDWRIAWPLSWPTQANLDLLEELQHDSSADENALEKDEPDADDAGQSELAPAGESPVTSEPTASHLAAGDELWDAAIQPEQLSPRPPEGAGALPPLGHGWICILASSFLFALAHLGNGPSPIALFAFAMVLGYVYQRTHRILPCIVAHFLLNLVSVTMLMLMVM